MTLRGAIVWASLLLGLADDAAVEQRTPLLPLPYPWHSAAELDEWEANDALAREDVIPPRRSRRQQTRRRPKG